MFAGHKKRAERVRGYFAGNEAIALITVLFAIAVLVNLVSQYQTQEQTDTEPETVQAEEHWRFYPVDLVVLGAGGGLCTAMMLREKRRAKEDLN
jgi:hypothetical protein